MDSSPQSSPQSSPGTSSPPKPKLRKFLCKEEGCKKAFTRAEHLQRHELNHRPSLNTCQRCRAHFNRPDLLGKGSPMFYSCPQKRGGGEGCGLGVRVADVRFSPVWLDRHMERHAQKDILAGGEGLGILVTRKRCWRDDNGNITTKRPAASLSSLPKPSTSPKSQKGKAREGGGRGSGGAGNMSGGDAHTTTTAPMSPVYSTASSAQRRRNGEGHACSRPALTASAMEVDMGAFDQFQSQQLEFVEPGMFESENFQLPSIPPQTCQLGPLLSGVPPSAAEATIAHYQAEFDEAFSTDPTSSFTTPFTTLGGYAWLFGESDGPSGIGGQCGTGFDLSREQSGMEMDLEPPFAAGSGSGDQLMVTPVDDSPFLLDVKTSTNTSETVSQQYNDFRGLRELGENLPVEDHSLYLFSDPQPMSHDTLSRDSHTTTTTTTNTTRHSLSSKPALTLSTPHTQHSTPVAGSPAPSCNHFHSYASTPTSTSESPSPTLSSQPLPKIDEVSCAEVLSLIIQATTDANGEPQFDWDDPLLSLSALQNYLDLFFSRFNPSYPLLHRPSFDPSNVHTLLLVSVLMLGATYGGKDAHQMAVRVYDGLRGALVSVGPTTPEVWRRKSGTNLYEFGRERICSLIIFMLRSNYGLYKRCY